MQLVTGFQAGASCGTIGGMNWKDLTTVDVTTALAATAIAAARHVAPYLRSVARSAPDVDLKRDIHDPVTFHDQHTEDQLRRYLGAALPGSRVLGEERGEETLDPHGMGFTVVAPHDWAETTGLDEADLDRMWALGSRVRWIVDPIDGTANFAAGLTYFGTSIGVELDGVMVAGVVSIPFNYEFFAADQNNAWHISEDPNKGGGAPVAKPMRSTGPTEESQALLTSYYPNVQALNDDLEAAATHERELMNNYSVVRRPGAGALDLAMVAAGWMGGVLATSFQPWDVAAGIHLIKVAGGNTLNLPMGGDQPDGLRPGIAASVGTLDAVTIRRLLTELDTEASTQ